MGFSSGSSTIVPSQQVRQQRRRRRQSLTFAGLFAVVLLAGVGALGNWLQWWSFGSSEHTRVACPVQTASLPGRTLVNVYNGTERRGLASAVSRELQLRGFRVLIIANEADAGRGKTVFVRFGTGDEIFARTVARQFPGKVRLVPQDERRPDHDVDVVIGDKYRAMQSRSAAAAAIALVPQPRGCVVVTPSRPPASATASPGA